MGQTLDRLLDALARPGTDLEEGGPEVVGQRLAFFETERTPSAGLAGTQVHFAAWNKVRL